MKLKVARRYFGLAAAVVTIVATGHAQTPAQDWPQWRGLRRTGEVMGAQAPAAWPATWQGRWRAGVGEGQFVALDAKTGTLKWGSEGRNADHASVLFTGTHVVYLTSTWDLMLVKRGAGGFTTDRQYEVAKSPTYAPPLFVDGDLFVRDATGVTRLKGA